MALTKRSESNTVYLQAKHYCLWREIKKEVPGCESVQVTNPKNGVVSTKYGYKFDSVEGHVFDVVKYDTERKYPTRYFGFKLHIRDGIDTFVLDMPYHSQLLRRFLRIAPNVDWSRPLSITIFKGKNKEKNTEELGVWFRQGADTIKPYFTKENPRGMPAADYDDADEKWDFRAQHRWLVDRLKEETILDIHEAAKKAAPPSEPHADQVEDVDDATEPVTQPFGEIADDEHRWLVDRLIGEIADDDVPF